VSAARHVARRLVGPRLTLALRLTAGAVLIYASYDKLLAAQAFADAVDDYRILPLALVNLTAVALPWVELVTGLCLIAGLATPGAGLVTAALAAVYCGALTSALLRGLEIGCGCFAGGEEPLLTWPDLWLRLALLAAGAQIALAARLIDWPLAALLRPARRGPRATGPTPDA
jgi:putative oxidoreductase